MIQGSLSGAQERIVEVRRRSGKLLRLRTSRGRTFLVLREPRTERFLEAGAVLRSDDAELLSGELARAAGLALAYRLLAARNRTEREIRSSLAAEGIEKPELVDELLETLRRQGYLNDRRFAADYIRYATGHRPAGPILLRRKLLQAGISDDVIESEIRAALPSDREREIALSLAMRKLDTGIERERAVRRVHGLLSRRGFSSSIVNEICAGILRRDTKPENYERDDPDGTRD